MNKKKDYNEQGLTILEREILITWCKHNTSKKELIKKQHVVNHWAFFRSFTSLC